MAETHPPLTESALSGSESEPIVARVVDGIGESNRDAGPVMAAVVEPPITPGAVRSPGLQPAAEPLQPADEPLAPPIARPPSDVHRDGPDSEAGASDVGAARADGQRPPGLIRRFGGFIRWMVEGSFSIVALVVLLAIVSAIPIIQFIALGYMVRVAGGLAAGAKLRDSLPHLRQAGIIGISALAVVIAALPTQLLAHWESVAALINPGSSVSGVMRFLAISASLLATVHLLWAWARGGRLRHFLWPQPRRFMREGFRWSTWKGLPDRLWDFTASLELPKYFWLGVRAAFGTMIWLIPAMIVILAFRVGETGLAGLVGLMAIMTLGVAMLYLPMLQANLGAENRLSALFEVRRIRRDFRRAPWAWLMAMIVALVLTPIPLYLLKIEVTPQEVVWLPCLIFVAFILPARMATGLALRRARRRPEPRGVIAFVSRWMVRALMPVVVGVYLLFVFGSQYTSWHGLSTWIQQHAIMIPVPFLSGL